jgi:hypothetical protein
MANSDALDLNVAPDSGMVRLEFTGDNVGSIWYTHPVSGTEYKGGNNSVDKYQDVPATDAPYLIGLGVFKRLVFNPDGTLLVSDAEKARLQAEAEAAQQAADAQAKAEADALAQTQTDLANQEAEFAAATAQQQLEAEAEAQAKTDASKTGNKSKSS